MVKIKHFLRLFFGAAAVFFAAACSDFLGSRGEGELCWRFDKDVYVKTKAAGEIPDTNDFRLEVLDAKGKVLYSGKYGASPESLLVGAGSYTVTVRSIEFEKPAFASPQFGDTQVVIVKAGERSSARLSCKMLNAGIRLQVNADFLSAYPKGVLYLRADDGKLMYGYSEKRIAFFHPGPVSLLLNDDGQDETLFTRSLAAQEVLTVGISAPSGADGEGKAELSIAVDTSKTWRYESYVIGGDSGGSSGGSEREGALDVNAARNAVGRTGVWVYGYIVGGDLTSGGASVKVKAPFNKKTHLALASRASTTAKNACIAVELTAGKLRDALNLVDHPELVGHTVYIKGDIVQAYFGTVGLKKVSDWSLE